LNQRYRLDRENLNVFYLQHFWILVESTNLIYIYHCKNYLKYLYNKTN